MQEINQIKDITEAKIAEINEKDEAQDAEISNIKSKNTELKAENERLREDLNNTVPSVSGEGENVILNNTSNARFKKFGISGNSYQETGNVTDEEGNVIGTMPSPEFRSEIKNVTGNANFHVVPELADISKFTTNGYVNGLGTISSPSGKGEKSTEPVKVKPNTNYTFFIINTNSKFDNWIGIGEYEEESSSSFIKRNASTASFKYNFTTSEKTNYVILSARNLEEATNVSFYETSKIQSFTFPLAEGQRLMKGDYLADDGIHHKRKQIVLTGGEDGWSWADTTRYALKIDNAKDGNGLCNQFKYNEYSTTVKIDNTFNVSNGYVGFYITNITSLIAFKNYLSEQYASGTPVIVEYDLAEEEIEACTSEQQAVYDEIKKTAHSYRDTTHIFSTDEISPIFNVEAKADIQAMFNNLQAQILAGEV